tara:strand:+ start:9394 stop:9741 length:348 start_codon:yes stop_codon:yes gene_type:complete
MSENFLISDSLKNILTKEKLFDTNYVKNENNNVNILRELLVENKKAYLTFNNFIDDLRETVVLNDITYREKIIEFNTPLKFKLVRLYHDNDKKNDLCTIVIDEELFWRALKHVEL